MCLPRRTSPYLSVAHADELAGLPPTFIGVGTLDLFVAESIAYAQQLIRCRVASELRIYPGVMHGFDWLKGLAQGGEGGTAVCQRPSGRAAALAGVAEQLAAGQSGLPVAQLDGVSVAGQVPLFISLSKASVISCAEQG